MKFTVFGAGSWGTALANVLAFNNHEVLIYSISEKVNYEINKNHANPLYFPGILLNNNVKSTLSLKEAISFSTNFVFAVPSANVDDLVKSILPFLEDKKYKILNTIKGFVGKDNRLMIPYLRSIIPADKLDSVCSIIGPSHAEEVIIKDLTCISVVNKDVTVGYFWQEAFSNDNFRVYTLEDEIGAEIAASYKNAIAIGSGIIVGLGFGDNAKAALITRGLAEIIKFGSYFNGKTKTFVGLTGVGDLIVTCNSVHSRNFSFGKLVGEKGIDFALSHYEKTVEGYKTIKALYEISKENNIDTPIITALYNALFLKNDVSNEIKNLMNRPLKSEF